MIYLDHSATTPLGVKARKAMHDVMDAVPGNPSSIHAFGRMARQSLNHSRERLADILNIDPESVIFTGSGSEANNLALKGFLLDRLDLPSHVIATSMEHPSTLNCLRSMIRMYPNISLSEINPGPDGKIRPQSIAEAIQPDTCLISIMHANNETGVIQPVMEISEMVTPCRAKIHVDAIQSFGKIPVDIQNLQCDLLTLSAHKFYGPKGMGALILSRDTNIQPLIHGGHQESMLRAGTENIMGAAGMAAAAEDIINRLESAQSKLAGLEKAFMDQLESRSIPFQVNGAEASRIPGVINLSIERVSGDDLVVGLDVSGIAISSGAACSSGVIEYSHVLAAMQLPEWRIDGGVRISFGKDNTYEEAIEAADRLSQLYGDLAVDTPQKEASTI